MLTAAAAAALGLPGGALAFGGGGGGSTAPCAQINLSSGLVVGVPGALEVLNDTRFRDAGVCW